MDIFYGGSECRGEVAKLAHPIFKKMITFKKKKIVLCCAFLYNMYLIKKL